MAHRADTPLLLLDRLQLRQHRMGRQAAGIACHGVQKRRLVGDVPGRGAINPGKRHGPKHPAQRGGCGCKVGDAVAEIAPKGHINQDFISHHGKSHLPVFREYASVLWNFNHGLFS